MYISRTRLYTPRHESPSDHNVYLFPKDRQQNAFSNSSFKQANSYLPTYQIQIEKRKDLVLQQGWKKIFSVTSDFEGKVLRQHRNNNKAKKPTVWKDVVIFPAAVAQTPALTIHSDLFTTVQHLLPVLKFLTATTNVIPWLTKEVTTRQHLGKYGAGCSLNLTLCSQKPAESLPLAKV